MRGTWIQRWTGRISYYIDRYSPLLILTPWAKAIGTCSEDMYFGLIKAKRDNKKILFLFPYELFWKFRFGITNRELLNLESDCCMLYGKKVWRVLGGCILTATFGPLRTSYFLWRKCLRMWQRLVPTYCLPAVDAYYTAPSIGRCSLWKPAAVDYFSRELIQRERWREDFDGSQPMTLSEQRLRRAEKIRIQMGIPLSDWFVCLHVREGGFRGDKEDLRNASIRNYYQGIQVITEAGGWVVRLGDPSMTLLPPMDRVIDYPHTSFKSDLMDLYLISQCRYVIGTNSGPSLAAMLLFKKRVVLSNLAECFFCPLQKGDLAIPKHIFSRSRNRFLSLKEILEEPFDFEKKPSYFPYGDDYIAYENTSEEIRDLIKEYLRKPADCPYSDLQEAFNKGRRAQIGHWLERTATSYESLEYQYRTAILLGCEGGALGQRYLEQNWLNDTMNQHHALLLHLLST